MTPAHWHTPPQCDPRWHARTRTHWQIRGGTVTVTVTHWHPALARPPTCVHLPAATMPQRQCPALSQWHSPGTSATLSNPRRRAAGRLPVGPAGPLGASGIMPAEKRPRSFAGGPGATGRWPHWQALVSVPHWQWTRTAGGAPARARPGGRRGRRGRPTPGESRGA
jgi:hypothetical protein